MQNRYCYKNYYYNYGLNSRAFQFFFISIVLFYGFINQANSTIEISPQVTIKGEYDDNVGLTDGINRAIRKDYIFYIDPLISMSHLYKNHKTIINLGGNYRKGIETELSNLNLNMSGDVALNFNNGLSLNFNDEYIRSSFDQALYDEAGVYNRQSNNFMIGTYYSFNSSNRLKLAVRYYNKWDQYDNESQKVDRTRDIFEGNLSIPLTKSISSYLIGGYEHQKSDKRKTRSYHDTKALLGINWKGPYRFTIWVQGGYEEISYTSPTMPDFKKPIGEAGVKILFTESAQGEFFVGKDGYDNLTYGAEFYYQFTDLTLINLSANKNTRSSFSTFNTEGFYEYTTVSLQLVKKILEKITATIGANYLIQDVNPNQKYDTTIGNFRINYSMQDWMKIGAYYQYSNRNSKQKTYKFKNSRIGVLFNFAM